MATRILLCGASSVGKTTLANDWCKRHPHFGHIEEIARSIMEEKDIKREDLKSSLSGDKKLFLDLQYWIFERQNEVESDLDQKGQSFVSDRGPDPLAFALFYGTSAAEEKLASTPPALSCLERYRGCNIVVLCPLDTCTDDGVRLMSGAYKERMRFTECLCTLLRKYGLPYIYCNVTDRNERLYFLEQITKQKYPVSTLLNEIKLLNNIPFMSKKPPKPAPLLIRSVEVSEETITTGYHFEESSRMLLRYHTDKFIHLKFDRRVKPDKIFSILRSGVWMNGEEFHFFGCSSRSMKTRACFLLKGPAQHVHEILNECGSFNDIKCPSKLLKRIGLLFSKCQSTHVIPFSVHCEPDIVSPAGNFTDGCGRIGVQLAADIVKNSQLPLDDGYIPSVFQIRYEGCKGVLAVDPGVKPTSVHVRPSMMKFREGTKPFRDICLCDHSRPYSYGHLNRQFITLLSGLRVKDEVFFTLQKSYHDCIQQMTRNAQVAVVISHWKSRPDLAAKIARADNFQEDKYIQRQLIHLQSTLVDKMDKLSILVEDSRNVFGVCDTHGVLKYGECFFRPTVAGTPKTLTGKVVICKNPCYLLGDVRVLTAVSDSRVKKMEHLTDCIVFPTAGDRPHADEIAGSDLDGDQFFVCWHKDLIPKHVHSPYSYPSGDTPPGDVSHGALLKFFAHFKSDAGKIDSYYRHWAEVEGIASRQCCQLGELFAASIDTSKTGAVVRIPKQLVPPRDHSQVVNKNRIWNRLLLEANRKKAEMKPALVSAESDLIPAISEEFVTSALQDGSFDATSYRLFRFAHTWCSGQNCTADEALTTLQRFSRDIHFGEFSLDQQVEAIDSGIPTPLVTNALNKSQILSSEMLESFLLHSEHSHWRFYFSSDQNGFEWGHMLRALERHSQSLVVMQLLNGVTIALHFMNSLSLGERRRFTAGSASAYIFSGKFAYRDRHILGQEYSYNLSSEVLQIYRGEPTRSFLWFGQPRPKHHKFKEASLEEEGSTCVSIDLTRFRGDVLRSGHPTITKQEFTSVEIYVKSERHQPAYFDLWYTEDSTSDFNSPELSSESDTESPVLSNTTSETKRTFRDCQHKVTALQGAATTGNVQAFCDSFGKLVSEKEEGCLLSEELSDHVLTQLHTLMEVLLDKHTLQRDLPHQLYQQLLEITTKLVRECAGAPLFSLHLICSLSLLYSGPLGTFVSAALKSVEFSNILQYLSVLKQWRCWLCLPPEVLTQVAEHVTSSGHALIDTLHPKHVLSSESDKTTSPDQLLPHYISRIATLCLWEFAQVQPTVQWKPIGSINSVQRCKFPCFEELRTSPHSFHTGVMSSTKPGTDQQNSDLKIEFCILGPDNVDYTSFYPGKWVSLNPISPNRKSDQSLPLAFGLVSHVSINSVPIKIVVDCVAPNPSFVLKVTPSIAAQQCLQWQMCPIADVLPFVRTISALRKLAEVQLSEIMQTVLSAHSFLSPLPAVTSFLGHVNVDDSTPADRPSKTSPPSSMSPDQHRALQAALSHKVTLIDGFSGTGKTYMACEIASALCHFQTFGSSNHCLLVLKTHSNVANVSRSLQHRGVRVVSIDYAQDTTSAMSNFSLRQQLHWKGFKPGQYSCKQQIQAQRDILKCAQVIVTTCAEAGDPLLQAMQFTCVIIDDATRISEVSSLIPITLSCQKLVLIGDSRECANTSTAPTASIVPPSSQSTVKPNMLVKENRFGSLFHGLMQSITPFFLDQQFRIPPNLAAFTSSQFCGGKLRTSEHVLSRPSLKRTVFGGSPSVFFDITGNEEQIGSSYRNATEAEAVCDIVTHLLNNEVSLSEITILTFYVAQVTCLKEALLPVADKVHIATVNDYRGQENDVVVFSCVQSRVSKEPENLSNCGTFPCMYNTLFTRGRMLFVVVGSAIVLKQSKLWSQWLGQKMTSFQTLENLHPQRNGGQGKSKASARGTSDKSVKKSSYSRSRTHGAWGAGPRTS